jgi:transposase
MAKPLVSDELWAVVAPLLPPEPPKPNGGRPRVPDRACLTGIIFVAEIGHPLGDAAPGDGLRLGDDLLAPAPRLASGWGLGGAAPHAAGPSRGGRPDRLEPGLPGQRLHPRQKGGEHTGPNPTDRGKPGTKRHMVTERGGLPLAKVLTGATRHDSTVFEDLLDAIPPIKTPAGRRRKRPDKGHADKAYDIPRCRRALTQRHIKIRIARKGIDASERLGRHRWVVERTLSWLSQDRRLTIRYERRADIHDAFLTLGGALICFKTLP